MSTRPNFRDRTDAGRQLATRLQTLRLESPIVLGLPRGGVVVAYEVADQLGAPLDVCVVKKLGAPQRPELGLGAVAEDGATYLDLHLIDRYHLSRADLAALVAEMRAAVNERVRRLRVHAAPLDIRGRTVIVVDDGVAMGGTARAALQTLRARGAARIVLAVPVAPARALRALADLADEVVCLRVERRFAGVGAAYDDFGPVEEDDVAALLRAARSGRRRSERVVAFVARDVQIPLDLASSPGAALDGSLVLPSGARGLVIFAHGNGSNRKSRRNAVVAAELQREGFATLLVDLLTPDEQSVDARTSGHRFDIPFLAARLLAVTTWARFQPELVLLPLGYFGARTGAAAALVAAAARPTVVRAIVTRGGRPELALSSLGRVRAPTLLIVGGDDEAALRVNREAMEFLACETRLEIVHGASHLFEEPGAIDDVARATLRWFEARLAPVAEASA